jgi:hypothetical protein
MSGKFRKRLEKLEQQAAEVGLPDADAECNCRKSTIACLPEHFKAEMNQTCPAHGFRRLGKINVLETQIVGKDGIVNASVGIRELVQEYERRLVQYQERLLSKDEDEEV